MHVGVALLDAALPTSTPAFPRRPPHRRYTELVDRDAAARVMFAPNTGEVSASNLGGRTASRHHEDAMEPAASGHCDEPNIGGHLRQLVFDLSTYRRPPRATALACPRNFSGWLTTIGVLLRTSRYLLGRRLMGWIERYLSLCEVTPLKLQDSCAPSVGVGQRPANRDSGKRFCTTRPRYPRHHQSVGNCQRPIGLSQWGLVRLRAMLPYDPAQIEIRRWLLDAAGENEVKRP